MKSFNKFIQEDETYQDKNKKRFSSLIKQKPAEDEGSKSTGSAKPQDKPRKFGNLIKQSGC